MELFCVQHYFLIMVVSQVVAVAAVLKVRKLMGGIALAVLVIWATHFTLFVKPVRPEVVSACVAAALPAGAAQKDALSRVAQEKRDITVSVLHEIVQQAARLVPPPPTERERRWEAGATGSQLRRELAAALAREEFVIHELSKNKKKLARLTGENVLPLRGPAGNGRDQGVANA